MMETSRFSAVLRIFGWLACAAWLLFAINREIFQLDASKLGFRAPDVVAEMKNCTSSDMQARYQCKEQAILAGQRNQVGGAIGGAAIVFGPPLAVWLLARWISRRRDRSDDSAPTAPQSIQKWRVI
jgi:hypothetical protein